jgi:gluconate 2-dehydrogenase gamma chain
MSETRRELLHRIGASVTVAVGAEFLPAQEAQHVHQAVAQDKAAGPYKPKGLTAHEYATLRRLSDLIIPADEHSKGALEAGAADFIDFLCAASEEMKDIYTGGLGWLDGQMMRRYNGKSFVDASPAQQTAMLDLIAYRKNASAELSPGIEFFSWARRMVVDGYYTSPIGIEDLGYMGNKALSEFSVPKEALDYALKRSPLA